MNTGSSRVRVLICEDDLITSTFLRRALEHFEYEISAVVSSGEEALEEVRLNRPDIVLMDIMIDGEMDGIEAAEAIKKIADVSVIYLTSYSDEGKLNRAETTEPFAYILKPIHERELHANIRMALYKKSMERQMRQKEALFTELFLQAPMAVFTCTQDFSLILANNRFYTLFGISPTAKTTLHLSKDLLYSAEEEEKFQYGIKRNGRINGLKFRFRKNDGSVLVGRLTLARIGEEEGGIFEGMIDDFTDKFVSSQNAKHFEKEFKNIFHSSHQAILLFNGEGTIFAFNERAAKMVHSLYGVPLQNNDRIYRYPLGISAGDAKLVDAKNSDTPTTFEFTVTDYQGKSRWFEIILGYVQPTEDSEYEYSLSAFEITERIEREEDMQKYLSELQQQHESLSSGAKELKLLNEKLAASEKQLLEANRNKDKLYSLVAHDLRAPFNNLLGFSSILLREGASMGKDELTYVTENLNECAKQSYRLLENLLHWTRLQSDRLPVKHEVVYPALLADEVSRILQPQARAKLITISVQISPLLSVVFDRTILLSSLQNLVSNSIKFTENQGSISISCREEEETVVIEVADTGRGIEKSVADRLFMPEDIVTTLGTNKETGSGLGLLLTGESLEKAGGQLKLTDTGPNGTVFSIFLPKSF